ncbi:MAG: [acyl-carrier-protein] S-malonyltransferase [Dehalococcoidia bacterium]|nr:[acyl-carrier-protein] S-malonyltransferase [Dehalococcoidia bacterium]
MGRDLYEQMPAARAVFEAADATLGFALSTLCFEGPEDELTRTVNTQPALVTHAIAALVAAIDAGSVRERAALVAGHSLGEYAALIAAGALPFAEGLRLVRERGRLMQEACDAHPGTMAAILGLERAQVAALCAEHRASLCNENAPGNVSIGGSHEAVRATSEAATAAGATRVVPLNVAGAFHTPLMQAAADGMRAVLASVTFGDPRVPVVSNVHGRPLTRSGDFAAELTDQVTSPVLWVDGVRTMLAAGATEFIEFGPGRVLTGALKRTERSAQVRNIGTAAEARGEATE